MSAWWKGKTRDELKDRKVSATTDTGLTVTGRLLASPSPDGLKLQVTSGYAIRPFWFSGGLASGLSPLIRNVETEDDGTAIRILDLEHVRIGDVAVFGDVRGRVLETREQGDGSTLKIALPATIQGSAWMYDSLFEYALRTPLPEEPGEYVGRAGGRWLRTMHGEWLDLTGLETRDIARGQARDCFMADMEMAKYAPFTRLTHRHRGDDGEELA